MSITINNGSTGVTVIKKASAKGSHIRPVKVIKKADKKTIWDYVHPDVNWIAMDANNDTYVDWVWNGYINKPVWIEEHNGERLQMWDDPQSTTYYPILNWKENTLPEKSLKKRPGV